MTLIYNSIYISIYLQVLYAMYRFSLFINLLVYLQVYLFIYRCPVYTNIPPVCRLEAQSGSCCKRVVCNTIPNVSRPPGLVPSPQTTPQPKIDPDCHDNINNCKDYGQDACGAIYKDWATRNCPMTCQICGMHWYYWFFYMKKTILTLSTISLYTQRRLNCDKTARWMHSIILPLQLPPQ